MDRRTLIPGSLARLGKGLASKGLVRELGELSVRLAVVLACLGMCNELSL